MIESPPTPLVAKPRHAALPTRRNSRYAFLYVAGIRNWRKSTTMRGLYDASGEIAEYLRTHTIVEAAAFFHTHHNYLTAAILLFPVLEPFRSRLYRGQAPQDRRALDRIRRMASHRRKRHPHLRLPCAVCGSGPAEYHHPDYNKPLLVVPLCRAHHSRAHRVPGYLESKNIKPIDLATYAQTN